METSARKPPLHLATLDGLRGIAAIIILLFHYKHFGMTGPRLSECVSCVNFEPLRDYFWPIYAYGDQAVPLFWTISGVVFAVVYFGGKVTTRSFVVNRFARLYPLHFITLIIVAGLQIVATATLSRPLIYGHNDATNFAFHLVMASNWLDDDLYTFNGPIWSVSAEVIVYAMFWALRSRLERAGSVGLFGLVSLFFVAAPLLSPSPVPQCAAYFFSGVVIAKIGRQRPERACAGALIIGLGLLKLGLWQSSDYFGYAGVVGSVVFFVWLEPFLTRRIGSAMRWLADCTYGLYLWHVPVQLALLLIIGPGEPMVSVARNPMFAVAWLVSMIVIARLSFRHLELPSRRWLRNQLSANFGTPIKMDDKAGRLT